jgi:hypothetical protein
VSLAERLVRASFAAITGLIGTFDAMLLRCHALPMLRALAVAAVLAAPAQPPPDERVAARAFADAGLRFHAAIEALEPQFDRLPTEPPDPRCAERARRRIPERHWDEVNLLGDVEYLYGTATQLIAAPLMQYSLALHSVETADPALRSGRTAIRRIRRAYATIQALPPVDVCAEIRRWVDGGFKPTPAIRRERRALRALNAISTPRFSRRLERTEARLRELGIPAQEADAFDGETESD